MDSSSLIYVLCVIACAACTLLLVRAWARVRIELLLWLGIGFLFLTMRSCLVVFDLMIAPDIDLSVWRGGLALVAVIFVAYGLARRTA